MAERSEADGKLQLDSLRSPCSDAHYEAFIIQSKWTVDNLYASNVNLGQDYVKRIKVMERQKKMWLLGKSREQQRIEKRMGELETARRCTSMSENKSYWRQQNYPLSVKTSRHESLEKLTTFGLTSPLTKKAPKTRSVSQPCGSSSFACNSLSENMEQRRKYNATSKGGQVRPRVNTFSAQRPQIRSSNMSVCSETELPLMRRTFSVSTPSLRLRDSGPQDAEIIDTKLIPKYVPSKLRSRKSTLF